MPFFQPDRVHLSVDLVPGYAFLGSDHDHGRWEFTWPLFIGLVVTWIGLAMTALGLMLQKYAHYRRCREDAQPEVHEDTSRSDYYFTDKWWMFGMVTFCIGNLVFWSVLALVPQVVLACWQCWAMIVTIFAAPPLLGETVSMGKLISVIIIVFGVIWVVLAAPRNYEAYMKEHFWDAVLDPAFLAISAAAAVTLAILLGSILCLPLGPKMSSMRYILTAAVINWYSVLSARCSSGFFLNTVVHQDNHTHTWEFGILVTCMLIFAICNVHFLNKALEIGEAIFVVPVYESLAISGQIMFGIIFFKEFEDLTLKQTLSLAFAMAVVIGGVILTTGREPPIRCLQQIVLKEDYCDDCCCCCRVFHDKKSNPGETPPDSARGKLKEAA